MPASIKDIYWLAGIIEGEGSFRCLTNGTAACISFGTVDKDIMIRVHNLIGHNYKIQEELLSSGKIMYRLCVYGNVAFQWMLTLFSILGTRRQNKIKEIITLVKNYKTPERVKLLEGKFCRNGHLLIGFNCKRKVGSPSGYVCAICSTGVKRIRDKALKQRLISKYDREIKYLEEQYAR